MASSLLRRVSLLVWLFVAVACAGPSPEKLLADARAALAAGQSATAEIHLKNLLRQQPDNAEARALLGEVSLANGDPAGSEQGLRRAIQLGRDQPEVRFALLRSLLAQGKFAEVLEEAKPLAGLDGHDRVAVLSLEAAAERGLRANDRAEAQYRAALAIEPKSAAVRSELAALLVDGGRGDEARALIEAILSDEPDFVSALLLRGNLESSARQYAAAEATMRRVMELERSSARRSGAYVLASAALTETLLAQGKVDEAATNADALLALDPRNPAAAYIKAAVEVQQNDLEGAEKRLEDLIRAVPQYWPAHRLLGAINIRQNQPGQAVMYLRNAVTNNPRDDAARLQLAELYIRQGNLDAAKELVGASSSTAVSDGLFSAFAGRASQQAGLQQQAVELFDRSERQAPQNLQELVGISNMYMAAGEFERAIRVLESASFSDARSEQLTSYLLALVQIRQGDLKAADATAAALVKQQGSAAWPLNLRATIAMASGDLPRAREQLAAALTLEPDNTSVLFNAARVAAAQNDAQQAERYLRRVVELRPNESSALIGLAGLAAQRRDYAAARTWLERAPESPARARLEAELLAVEGKNDEAAVAFERAYDAQPSSMLALRAYDVGTRAGRPQADTRLKSWSASNPQDAAANFALGSISLAKNEQEDAIRRYEAVLATNPQHPATLNNLAWLYSERKDPRAVDYAERALAAEPRNASIADTLGWIYVQSGDARKALPLLEQAAAALSNQPEVTYHRAVALAETGDRVKAIAALQQLLASGGDFSGRADAQQRLAALQSTSQP